MPNNPDFVGPFERLMLLKAVSLSGEAPAAALGALARQALERHLSAGETINARWEGAYVVVEGLVVVHEDGEAAYSAGPKEAFGLLETLARVEEGVAARAELPTLVLEITETTLFSVLEDHYVLMRATTQALARRLLEAPRWLASNLDQHLDVPDIASSDRFDLVARIRLLRESGVFKNARVGSLAEIACEFEAFQADAGDVLWAEDDPADWFVVLIDGRVESTSNDGVTVSWTRGMVPGLLEVFAGRRRWHRATAATRVVGLRLSGERLFDALEDDFAMAADVLSALAARARLQRRALGGLQRPGGDTRDSVPPQPLSIQPPAPR
jgi:CRP-like cAMP-binding protein